MRSYPVFLLPVLLGATLASCGSASDGASAQGTASDCANGCEGGVAPSASAELDAGMTSDAADAATTNPATEESLGSGPSTAEETAVASDASADSPSAPSAVTELGTEREPPASEGATSSTAPMTDAGGGADAGCEGELESNSECEHIGDLCVIRLPATFRDFSQDHVDFGDINCGELVPGLLASRLSDAGRPVLTGDPTDACISSADSFAQWYVDGPLEQTVMGELLLFGDGAGNYVNRYQDDGQQFTAVDSSNERFGGSTEDECQAFCAVDVAANCESTCDILEADAAAKQANYDAGLAAEPALSGDELAQLQQAATDAAMEADACTAGCAAGQETAVAACVPTCKPCSYSTLTSSPAWCMYGELIYFDGDPLFFPVDGVTGATADFARARLSADYGYAGYPDEDDVIADAPLHNFYFTTEVQTSFVYTANMNASIEVAGDDDVWVFVNGNLAIDLGGLHQPQTASATISSATAPALGLEEGGTYPISIFHAERALYGSTLLLKFNGLLPLGQAGSSGCQVN